MTITIVLCVEGASSGTENEQHKTVKADQWQISSLFHRTTMHTSHISSYALHSLRTSAILQMSCNTVQKWQLQRQTLMQLISLPASGQVQQVAISCVVSL